MDWKYWLILMSVAQLLALVTSLFRGRVRRLRLPAWLATYLIGGLMAWQLETWQTGAIWLGFATVTAALALGYRHFTSGEQGAAYRMLRSTFFLWPVLMPRVIEHILIELGWLKGTPVSAGGTYGIPTDDDAMQQAMGRARATVGELVEEMARGNTEVSVKLPVRDGETVEHMWLRDLAYVDGIFSGVIDNDPDCVTTVKCGDAASVGVGEISDWMYRRGGRMFGNYTLQNARERMSPAEERQLDAVLEMGGVPPEASGARSQPLMEVIATLEGAMEEMRPLAQTIAAQLMTVIDEPLSRYEPLTARLRTLLLRPFFIAGSRRLEELGFRALGDFHPAHLTEAQGNTVALRLFVHRHGFVCATLAFIAPARPSLLQGLLLKLRGGWVPDVYFMELSSEFVDGAIIDTTNSSGSSPFKSPPPFECHKLPPETSVDDLMLAHVRNVNFYKQGHPGAAGVRVRSVDDYLAAVGRARLLRSRSRRALGGVTDEELRELLKDQYPLLGQMVRAELDRLLESSPALAE